MKVFHISHIDLDGYGCMVLTDYAFGDDVTHYACNYGDEITNAMESVFEAINDMRVSEPALILITDLNLNEDQAAVVNDFMLNTSNVDLLLLDHHGTGRNVAELYEWYCLDTEMSGTMAMYKWLIDGVRIDSKHTVFEELLRFVSIVNDYDMWHTTNKEYHEIGKVLTAYVMEVKHIEPTMFGNAGVNFRIMMLKYAADIIIERLGNHRLIVPNQAIDVANELESMMLNIQKEIFLQVLDGYKARRASLDYPTLNNLLADYLVMRLLDGETAKVLNYTTEDGVEHAILVTVNIPDVSVTGNSTLLADTTLSAFLNINMRKGSIGIRANNQLDVSAIAKKYFDGGGHPNAAGGRIKLEKPLKSYDEAFDLIRYIIAL